MPRDSNGNMTLVVGNPVVSNTAISSSWANATLSDLAAEIQDSLSRSGKGGMLVSFNFANGTVSNPGITFTNDTTTGARLNAAGDLRIVVSGADALKILSGAVKVLGTLETSSGVTIDAGGLALAAGGLNLTGTTITANQITSATADAANAVAFTLNTTNSITNGTAKLLSLQNNGTAQVTIDRLGNIVALGTLTAYGYSATHTGSGALYASAYATWNGSAWTGITGAVGSITQSTYTTTFNFTGTNYTSSYTIIAQTNPNDPTNVWVLEPASQGTSSFQLLWKKSGTGYTAPNTGAVLYVAVF